jgi:hypothetical protein
VLFDADRQGERRLVESGSTPRRRSSSFAADPAVENCPVAPGERHDPLEVEQDEGPGGDRSDDASPLGAPIDRPTGGGRMRSFSYCFD